MIRPGDFEDEYPGILKNSASVIKSRFVNKPAFYRMDIYFFCAAGGVRRVSPPK